MSLSSLSANPYTSYSERYRPRRQGHSTHATLAPGGDSLSPPADPLSADDGADLEAPTWALGPAAESASYASKFKADLSRLANVEPWSDEPAAETAPRPNDFLDNLSALLASVRSGDVGSARVAANALQYELLTATAAPGASPNPASDHSGRLLDDLRALIRAARLGDTGGAQSAAQNFASEVQSALVEPSVHYVARTPARAAPRPEGESEPSSPGLGATAAYETLLELAEASADSPL